MTKTLVERLPHWRVTNHGVATPDEVERCILKIAEEDAALAYRLEGYVASAASRIEELERAMKYYAMPQIYAERRSLAPAVMFDRGDAARSALSDKG